MSSYGMALGLALGLFCATLTYTIQSMRNINPIKNIRSADSFRSSTWRSTAINDLLHAHSDHIKIVHLQGQLFFGNATFISMKLENMFLKALEHEEHLIRYLVLDFTSVFAIDSSAAETIVSTVEICERYNVKLCIAGLLPKKFSSASKLSKKLKCLNKNAMKNIEKNEVIQKKEMRNTVEMKQENLKSDVKTHLLPTGVEVSCYDDLETNNDVTIEETVFLSSSLDEGLAWCENAIIRESFPSWNPKDSSSSSQLEQRNGGTSKPKSTLVYLRQMQDLCPSESERGISMLFQRFKKESVKKGTVLW
eukprot:CAMPEP_0119046052 /NCGR_PEP_ID=MMETSP1177-20130426/44064_1 /TAXON_ID=2985 /ORGANISM="Ochromonas sp, Strain CCMP1899" /LENGTH=306 /DNA_ID=CAMNT_0007018663 /DNA_START=1346 /DNA_END=2263 /DNA_ORIENTATION=-